MKLTDVKNIETDIEVIESGYEFLLAYAAQGRPPHSEDTSPPPHARPTLTNMAAALVNVNAAFQGGTDEYEQVIAEDVRKAGAAINFVLAQPRMSSELVDNLNASIHLRAVLTDLFLYSEVFKPAAEAPPSPAYFNAG